MEGPSASRNAARPSGAATAAARVPRVAAIGVSLPVKRPPTGRSAATSRCTCWHSTLGSHLLLFGREACTHEVSTNACMQNEKRLASWCRTEL